MKTYSEIQNEIEMWSGENFNTNETRMLAVDGHPEALVALDSLAPLMGLVEEMGEMAAAGLGSADGKDAIGDMMIYLCDYLARENLPWPLAKPVLIRTANLHTLAADVGRLHHAHLKRFQGIRGQDDKEKFNSARNAAVCGIIVTLHSVAVMHHGAPAIDILNEVWAEVQKRDWKANPDTGVDAPKDEE